MIADTPDSLLTRLQTLDSDDEVTIYHVVEEERHAG